MTFKLRPSIDGLSGPSSSPKGREAEPFCTDAIPTVWERRQARIDVSNYIPEASWALWPLVCCAILTTTLCVGYVAGTARYAHGFVNVKDSTQVDVSKANYTVRLIYECT